MQHSVLIYRQRTGDRCGRTRWNSTTMRLVMICDSSADLCELMQCACDRRIMTSLIVVEFHLVIPDVDSFIPDGNFSTNLHDGSCSMTYGGSPAGWWLVDLGQTHPIRRVVITNRGDCCSQYKKLKKTSLIFSTMVCLAWLLCLLCLQ